MDRRWIALTVGGIALSMLGACATVMGDTESTIAMRTNPAGALCSLTGQDGFAASVTTPGSVTIPHNASPVTVNCEAPGYRRTSSTLRTSADGWMWANGALIISSAGVMALGAVIDEALGAGQTFAEEVEYSLDPDRPRPVNVRSRDSGASMRLEAR